MTDAKYRHRHLTDLTKLLFTFLLVQENLNGIEGTTSCRKTFILVFQTSQKFESLNLKTMINENEK